MTTATAPALSIRSGPFTLHDNGLEVSRSPSLSEWIDAGRKIQLAHKSSLWWLGDWLLRGEEAGIDWAGQHAEIFDESFTDLDTLRRARQVASLFPPDRRRGALSWSHHRDVAGLEPRDADRLLNAAERHNWPRDKLRKAVRDLSRSRPAVEAAEAAPAGERLRADGSVGCGDFKTVLRQLPADSAQLVFARMPQERRDVHWYGSLARVCARVLKPGGSLLMRTGPHLIGDVIQAGEAHLRYLWTFAAEKGVYHLDGIDVQTGWAPWVWFVKDRLGQHATLSDWLPRNGEGEDGVAAAEAFVDNLTAPGDLVVDPFCGAGAGLEVAARRGRKVLGVDLDEATVRAARRRLGMRVEG
jgi:hypothetical protein